jgi:hypothetical protein
MKRILEWFRARRRTAQTQIILHGLSDHTLRDIGLRRDQIDYLRVDELPRPQGRQRTNRPRVRAITVLRAS